MNKAILRSLSPKQCERIASGKQTIILSKAKPKIDVPHKEYIYEIYDKKYVDIGVAFGNGKTFEHACKRVIGEFVCDRIDSYIKKENNRYWWTFYSPEEIEEIKRKTCLTLKEIVDYAGNGKTLYGLHISQLKIYDTPKELGEFRKPCDRFLDCINCRRRIRDEYGSCENKIIRPPQSWCHVEELDE